MYSWVSLNCFLKKNHPLSGFDRRYFVHNLCHNTIKSPTSFRMLWQKQEFAVQHSASTVCGGRSSTAMVNCWDFCQFYEDIPRRRLACFHRVVWQSVLPCLGNQFSFHYIHQLQSRPTGHGLKGQTDAILFCCFAYLPAPSLLQAVRKWCIKFLDLGIMCILRLLAVIALSAGAIELVRPTPCLPGNLGRQTIGAVTKLKSIASGG